MNTDSTPFERLAALYNRAFEEFGSSALRGLEPQLNPRPAHALTVIRCLRCHNDVQARVLAEQLQEVRLTVLRSSDP